ncbi:hypothetical protein GJ699_05795 [Duganella sp. FT80W]|uniref:DUF6265 domain-containing protein n=1 Tax=Duganella guangzhouensis TaxID=2666084 RepID=A0A6I2KUW6_9BURK|nr:DUF6265 family protein [Duganella guangzhouensis]MRW89491.1 hypothetical protein [Duganella guangzhouensis]
MRKPMLLSACLLATLSAGAAPLDQLAWLSGCWTADGGEPGSGEQWTTTAGGAMMGMSRTIKGGKVANYEFMRITSANDDAVIFHAQPSGQEGASFTAIALSATEVVFENQGHDFPQKVIYRYQPPNQLRAAIEGSYNGKARRIEFPMTRAACAGQVQTR